VIRRAIRQRSENTETLIRFLLQAALSQNLVQFSASADRYSKSAKPLRSFFSFLLHSPGKASFRGRNARIVDNRRRGYHSTVSIAPSQWTASFKAFPRRRLIGLGGEKRVRDERARNSTGSLACARTHVRRGGGTGGGSAPRTVARSAS